MGNSGTAAPAPAGAFPASNIPDRKPGMGAKRGQTAKEKVLAFAEEQARLGVTNAELCRRMGWQKSLLSNLKRNPKANVTAHQAEPFAKFANVPVSWLLDPETRWPYLPPTEEGVRLTAAQKQLLEVAEIVSGGDPTLAEALARLVYANGPRPAQRVEPLDPPIRPDQSRRLKRTE
jgi:transcriptional regulator with XRE-family HTH domain